jgi:hypothetical protein
MYIVKESFTNNSILKKHLSNLLTSLEETKDFHYTKNQTPIRDINMYSAFIRVDGRPCLPQ